MRSFAGSRPYRAGSLLPITLALLSGCAAAETDEGLPPEVQPVPMASPDAAAPWSNPDATDAGPWVDAATPTDAGAAVDAATSVDVAPATCSASGVKASEVVMIGDSYYHITEIPQNLWQHARSAGLLGEGETYRYYYMSGAMMAKSSLIAPIPTQYDQARTEDPAIRYVIMNGGGNDVLVGDRSCLTQAPPQNAGCAKTIADAVGAARTLFQKMAADGVEKVIYSFYPHMPKFGLFQGDAPAINDTLDYGEAEARKACEENVSPPCVFVSTVAAFEGHEDYLNPLDVHASPAGSKVAGQLIWDAMVQHCIAQ